MRFFIVVLFFSSCIRKSHRTYPYIQLQRVTSETLLVTRYLATDTSMITLIGDFQDEVIACDSCLLVRDGNEEKIVPYWAVNDSLFLLPVLGTNWRILLYVLDFKSKKNLQPGNGGQQYIETYSEQFVYDAFQRTITVEPEPKYDKNLNVVKSPKDIYIFKDTAFILQKNSKKI